LVAPDAFSVIDPPGQIEGDEGVTDTDNELLTVTMEDAELLHPDEVPDTVYVVVLAGEAETVEPDDELSPDDGVQV
jgi:hypothetical protein